LPSRAAMVAYDEEIRAMLIFDSVKPQTFLIWGAILYGMAMIHPALLLLFSFALAQFVAPLYRSNDSGEARRRKWKEMISDDKFKPAWFDPPEDIDFNDGYWVNGRGMCLYNYVMKPKKKKVKGVVMFCHGYSEHASWLKGKEYRRLVRAGYAVMALEYEGHGRSDGLLALIPSWSTLIGDVCEYMFETSSTQFPNLPLFVCGESMGGAVAYEVSDRMKEIVSGTVFVAPMVAIHENIKPPPIVIKAFYKIVGPPNSCGFIGTLPLAPSKDLGDFSFKLKEKRELTDAHCNFFGRKPRLATARELLDTTDRICASLADFTLPFFVIHGEADKVTDPELSKMFVDKSTSKDKTLKLYEGMWHTPTVGEADKDIEVVFKDMIKWLDERS